jgi:lipopolysaccharide exporter
VKSWTKKQAGFPSLRHLAIPYLRFPHEGQPGMADHAGLKPAADASSILSRTARGAGWTIGWRLSTRVIGFCSTLILVRLLTPQDFGIVSLAIGFFQALDSVVGFGVEGAIIRADRMDRSIYDAGFTINVVRGLFTSLVLAASAIPVARFFGSMQLVNVIYVLAAGWAISAFQNVGMVEFRRDLAFDMEFKVQIIPRLLALAVTIPAAFIWHSYWALVAGMMATRIITVVLGYMMHPFRPRFGVAGMPHIFSFSFWEWVIGLLGMLGGRADTVIIGRLLGTGAVGVYGVGGEIASLTGTEIVGPLCRALFSGFVAGRRAGDDGADTLLRVLSLLALITFPLSVGLSLVAYPVIKIGFGTEWLGAVPLVQVLGVSATVSLFSAIGETLFSAHAWLKTILGMTAMFTALRLALLLALIPHYGLLGGALAGAIMGLFQEVIYMGTVIRRLKIRLRAMLRCLIRPAGAVAIMAATLALAGLGWTDWDGNNAELGINLAVAVGLGALVYVASLIGLWLAAGRPAGAEADVLSIIKRLARHA